MRRIVIAAVGVTVALLAGVVIWAVADDGGPRRTAALSSYTTTYWGLFAGDGKEFLGRPSSATCGVVGADVGAEPGTNPDPKKIGTAKYETCRLSVSPQRMQPAFYSWVNDTLGGKVAAKDLWLVAFDSDVKPQLSYALDTTLLTGLELSKLDAGTNAAVALEASLAPARIRMIQPSGTLPATAAPKTLTAANFRLTLDGQSIVAREVDGWAFALAASGENQVPKLGHIVLEVPESQTVSIQTLDKFLQNFLVGGTSDSAAERSATLSLLSTDQTEIVKLSFKGVGVFRGSLAPAVASDSVGVRQYSLYAENAGLSVAAP